MTCVWCGEDAVDESPNRPDRADYVCNCCGFFWWKDDDLKKILPGTAEQEGRGEDRTAGN